MSPVGTALVPPSQPNPETRVMAVVSAYGLERISPWRLGYGLSCRIGSLIHSAAVDRHHWTLVVLRGFEGVGQRID